MSSPDLVEVLAHLDFAVAIPINTSLAPNETEHHIDKVLGDVAGTLGDRYTTEDIRSLLWQTFSQGEEYAEHNFVQLFLHGSSELALKPETRRLVKDQLKLIFLHEPKAGKAGRRLRRGRVSTLASEGAGKLQPRRCRARATKQGTGRVDKKHQNIISKKSTLQNMVFQANDDDVSASPYQTIQASSKSCIDVEPASLRRMQESETTSDNPIIYTLPRLGARKPAAQPPPKIDQAEASSDELLNLEESHLEKTSVLATELAHYKRLYYKGKEKRHDQEESHQETVLLLTIELAHYKSKYHESVEERAQINWKAREIEAWRNTHTRSAEIIWDQDRQIQKLKKKLITKSDFERHFDVDSLGYPMSNNQPLSSMFSELKSHVLAIPVINGTTCIEVGRVFGESQDLDDLLSTVYPGGRASFSQAMSSTSSKPTLCELVTALTGAAIHQWVFGNEFPWPAMVVTPLLQKYREHIGHLCGDKNLFHLDRFVHRSMVEEEAFKEAIIPMMASTFTTRFLKAVQPLLKEELRHKTTKRLQDCIHGISSLTMCIRSMSLLGTEKYVSIWPSANSNFDDRTMETADTDTVCRIGTVRLPLCPGIQAYPKQADVVDYQGFGHADESEVPSKDALKALVVC